MPILGAQKISLSQELQQEHFSITIQTTCIGLQHPFHISSVAWQHIKQTAMRVMAAWQEVKRYLEKSC